MRTDPRADDVRRLVEEVFIELAGGRKGEGGRRKAEGGGNSARAEAQRGKGAADPAPLSTSAAPRRKDSPSGLRLHPSSFIPHPSPFRLPPPLEETILIEAGRCVGRSYRTGGYWAQWLIGLGLVQFYNVRGDMLATISLFRSLRPARMAA